MNTVERKLRERHLDPAKYHVSWDDQVATFLLFNLSGQVVGYQNYRWYAEKVRNNDPRESKYFTYASKPVHFEYSDEDDAVVRKTTRNTKPLAVWGLETYDYRNDILFLTEGVFDAVQLHRLGLPAVALLSNDPKPLRSWLRTLPRHVVAVCDGDKAGRALAKMGDESIILPDEMDLGDMTDQEVKDVVQKWL